MTVDVALVPFGDADNLFMTAAQGSEAPDLMRLSSDQLGAIGEFVLTVFLCWRTFAPISLRLSVLNSTLARFMP